MSRAPARRRDRKARNSPAPRAPERRGGQVAEWAKSLVIAAVLFLFIRTFLVQTFTITSGSMEDTLLIGDFLVVSRLAYGPRIPGTDVRLPGYESPERGDIVVFEGPHQPELDLVKRLVGLPGDTLAMRAGVLYRNGAAVVEPYARHTHPESDPSDPAMLWQVAYLAPNVSSEDYHPTMNDWGPIVVPPDRFFMLGDNRDESLDSRYWGFVDRSLIKGRALILYFSYDREPPNRFPWLQDVRWGRIGDVIR